MSLAGLSPSLFISKTNYLPLLLLFNITES
jgi:hypothetical protein